MDDGRTTATVLKKRHSLINECLSFIVAENLIIKNPTYKVKLRGTKPRKLEIEKYISYEESIRLITELKKISNPLGILVICV